MQNASLVDVLYVQSLIDNSLTRVISPGGKLDGKVIDRFDFRQQGLDGANTAFRVEYADETEAIYLAKPPLSWQSGPVYVPFELDPTRRQRVDLAFGSSGGGITEPLYLAPTEPIPAEYREFVVEGPAFASLVLPDHVDTEIPVSLFLYNEEEGGYFDEPVYLLAGVPYDLLSLNPNGFRRFRLTSLPIVADPVGDVPDPLSFGAVGVTFLEATDSMASLVISAHAIPEPSSVMLAVFGICVWGICGQIASVHIVH